MCSRKRACSLSKSLSRFLRNASMYPPSSLPLSSNSCCPRGGFALRACLGHSSPLISASSPRLAITADKSGADTSTNGWYSGTYGCYSGTDRCDSGTNDWYSGTNESNCDKGPPSAAAMAPTAAPTAPTGVTSPPAAAGTGAATTIGLMMRAYAARISSKFPLISSSLICNSSSSSLNGYKKLTATTTNSDIVMRCSFRFCNRRRMLLSLNLSLLL